MKIVMQSRISFVFINKYMLCSIIERLA